MIAGPEQREDGLRGDRRDQSKALVDESTITYTVYASAGWL